MKQSAILIVSIFYCAFFVGQDLRFSRNFQTIKKNVPLAIVNNSADYFYVLRYNKLAHDLIVERRRKSSAEMINISPFKMDSVNARSFNYENLDYLFFADQQRVYLVFEKVTTGRRSVYLKTCDTNGHAGPFQHLTSIERTGTLKDFYFTLKEFSNGRVMIVGTKVFHDNSVSRIVYLFDVTTRKFLWEKKLPPENESAGFAQGFEIDRSGNLYFLVVKSRLIEYRRQYVEHFQRMMPVYHYDSVGVRYMAKESGELRAAIVGIKDFSQLNSINLFVADSTISATAHYSKFDPTSGKKKSYFLGQSFTRALGRTLTEAVTPLKKELSDKLDFFDGGDTRDAVDKVYEPLWKKNIGAHGFHLSGRVEENFSKEMIFWHTNLNSGKVVSQSIVPRKIFYFAGRSRFKQMGVSTTVTSADTVFTFVLEHVSNEKVLPKDFIYSKFQKQEYATYANLACYYYSPGAEMKKKVILKNIDYDCIPLNYQGIEKEIVFFQSRGSVERFVFLKPSQF